jgi:hypothetical protein
VKDAPTLAYVYVRETRADADTAHVLTIDEAHGPSPVTSPTYRTYGAVMPHLQGFRSSESLETLLLSTEDPHTRNALLAELRPEELKQLRPRSSTNRSCTTQEFPWSRFISLIMPSSRLLR